MPHSPQSPPRPSSKILGQPICAIVFAASYVAGVLIVAATHPDLNGGRTPRQRASELLVARGCTVLFISHAVAAVRHGVTATGVLPLLPTPAELLPGQALTPPPPTTLLHQLPASLRMARTALTKGLTLSTWLRLSCALHTLVYAAALIPVFVLGLQVSERVRHYFPAWKVLRLTAVVYGLNDTVTEHMLPTHLPRMCSRARAAHVPHICCAPPAPLPRNATTTPLPGTTQHHCRGRPLASGWLTVRCLRRVEPPVARRCF